ncbi:MAG TPA: EAL domain-containing protein [Burkholderiales bacterium]|nr:EAL domain-containing protein [Burkholderiales bacterium]
MARDASHLQRAFHWLRTLRARLLALILLSLLPETFLSINDSIEERQLELRALQQDARRFAEFIVLQQREIIADGEQLLRGMAVKPEIAAPASESRCRDELKTLLRIHPQYVNFHVLHADGTLACSANPVPPEFKAAQKDYFREALSTGRFAISGFELSASRGIGELVLALPVTGGSPPVQYVITAALDLSWMSRLWQHADLPTGAVLTVVDRRGMLLAALPGGAGKPGMPAFGEDPGGFARLAAAGGRLDVELTSSDRVARAFSFEPIRGASSTMYVGVGIPLELARDSVQAMFYRKIALAAAGAAVLFLVSWWGSQRFVRKPIESLSEAARRLERGELAARAEVGTDESELGRLARAFNAMAQGIETRERGIRAALDDLERSSRALRTLSASNRALVHAAEEQRLMEDICRAAVEQGGYRMAWVGWAERDEAKTIRPRAHAGHGAGFLAVLAATWGEGERGRGTSGQAIRSGRTNIVNDALGEARLAPWHEELRSRGYLSVISLPLRLDGEVVGALTIYAGDPHAFTPEAVALLEELGDDLSFGLSTLRMRQREKEASEALRRLAYYDASTGLPNRAALRERLDDALAAAKRENRSLAVMIMSLDNYREIANTLGLLESEKLLTRLVPRLTAVAAESEGFLARVQSAEFGVLLPRSGAQGAIAAASRLLAAIDAPVEVSGSPVYVHGSAGIALHPGHAEDAAILMRCADTALYHAQKTGGYMIYEATIDQGAPERIAMIAELKLGIEAEQLLVYCQPKVDLATRRVIGAEALVRWGHPAKGLVSPRLFIPLAERTGLIKPLTYWMLDAACRQCRAWRDAGLSLPLAVNLSARNLRDPRLLDTLRGLFATWAIGHGELEIELTESTLMEDPAGAQEVIRALHAMDIPLYIDDFGTGYSSLTYLERLPVNAVKIDQSFIAAMGKTEGATKIVRSIIELAHNLGMKAVAEGIETAEALEHLAAMGCDGAQGYYIARPMPAGDVAAWLAASPWR